MNRAPVVLAGTAAGLIGVIAYPTSSNSSAVSLSSSTGSTSAQSTSTASATTTQSATTQSATKKAASATASVKTRTATGSDVSFQYGDLQVKVTMTGTRVSNIAVVQLNASDPHSQGIDQSAIPQLQQEAMSAQSAKIDGVSGASYTSAAYEQSLQAALDKLKA
jgi:uncharacterized protein with FMN-binding domain